MLLGKKTMKIAQINPGLIEIPPKGWGAIEVIIWNYKKELEKLGHTVDLKFPNDDLSIYDIVHVHVGNQAIYLKDRGIPYIFTMHDSHIYANGKNDAYYQNLEAIKHSIISIIPSKYHFDYFEVDKSKMIYLSHGVDRELHPRIKYNKNEQPKILTVAANHPMGGLYDNKGFLLSIEIAKEFNIPITIGGPNENWFANLPHDNNIDYDKLTIINENLSKDKLNKLFSEHDIFVHISKNEAGQPCLILLEALSSGLPVISHKMDDDLTIEGIEYIGLDVKQGIQSVKKILNNYEEYSNMANKSADRYSWKNIIKNLERIYKNYIVGDEMRDKLINAYSTTVKNNNNFTNKMDYEVNINYNFIEGGYCEILGDNDKKYHVKFIDQDKDEIVFQTILGCNQWCRTARKWFTNYRIDIECDGKLIFHTHLEFDNRWVYIAVDSSSLGDTVAWFPYIEEFRKKHNCKVIVSTFWNHLFEKNYPHLKFIRPGESAENIIAMYKLGIFGDGYSDLNSNVTDTRKEPLQKVACDLLGLEFKEIKPQIVTDMVDLNTDKKIPSKKERINIVFDSKSLGDTIAWFPYVEEYRKKNNVDIIVTTNWNFLFEEKYPYLEYATYNDVVNYDKKIFIGLFTKDHELCKTDYREISLQRAATELLDLEHKEIKPELIDVEVLPKYKNKKYVTLAIQSTAQAKYWNNDGGWKKIRDYLKTKGYDVVVIDKYKKFGSKEKWNEMPKGAIDETGANLNRVMRILKGAKFHLGLSAGLSWLAWAMDVPVVMVSGFSKPWTEFQSNIIRLHNDDVCNGCYNNTNFKLDTQDWMWCPENKNFECSKSITVEQVKEAIDLMIKNIEE